MRALVISAFALTLFISAVTVYLALSSDTLDGEPYAVIAIEPPKNTLTATTTRKVVPVASKVVEPATEASVTTSQSVELATTTSETTTVPTPASDTSSSTPTLTPATAIDESGNEAVEETLAQTDEATAAAAEPVNRRTTEVARPVSTTQDVAVDPFFSAEPGIGLGVGNLGPLNPEAAN